MRIGIDYTAALWQGAGIGRYTRELVRHVLEAGPQHQYCLFFASYGLDRASPFLQDLQELHTRHANVRVATIPLPPRRLTQIWHRLRVPLPIEVFTGALDVLHAPDFVPPPTYAQTIVTIHDLSYMVHPECALPSVARYLNSAVPRSVASANAILVDSQATQRDLQRLLAVDPARVTVVYPGVSTAFQRLPPEATASVRQDLGLPERFLLFVSTLEPRKNVPRLLEAYASVLAELEHMPLVLAGRKGWMYEAIFEAIERLNLQAHVRLLNYVDDKVLPSLYNLAWAFVYPSIYEGFGIPALEALACGTPVLTANNSSLPEVVGAAAVLVDAHNVESIASGLQQITHNQQLRDRLHVAGPIQAQAFTWQLAANQVLEEYAALANSGNRIRSR
jgi:glycosyltransferase involved in cell wall biosynthesis